MPRQNDNLHIPQLDRLANAELAKRAMRVIWVHNFLSLIVAFVTDLYRLEPAGTALYTLVSMALGYLRLRTAHQFQRIHVTQPRRWLGMFMALTMLQALSTGAVIPAVFFSHGAGWAFIICLLSVTGISAGSTSSLSPRLKLFRAFQIALLSPTIITMVLFGEGRVQTLSLLVLLWIGQVLVLGNYFHKEFWSGLRAHHQLRLRAEALEKAKQEVEEAIRIKGDFLANTSHELRTPLNGIIGMTDLVLESELTAEQKDHLEDVKTSGETLLKIINEILDFSKLDAGRVKLENVSFNLAELFDKAVRPIRYQAQSRGNELTVDLDEKLPGRFRGDPHRLWQVLTNLLSNAVKFTENGRIGLQAEMLGCTDELCQVAIRVHDTGIGVSSEAQETIFEAFSQADGSTTRKYGGTGLGLAITRQLVELMGGKLTLESEEGRGSTFSIVLDLPRAAEVEPTVSQGRTAFLEGSLEGMKILLAEDNTVNAKLATRVLEKDGVLVDWVADGQQVLEAWQKGRYDLILMDVQMPLMDGFEATEAIRAAENEGERIPIIALTAHAIEGYRDQCLSHGMDDYLTKPLNPRLLRENLRKWAAQLAPQSV